MHEKGTVDWKLKPEKNMVFLSCPLQLTVKDNLLPPIQCKITVGIVWHIKATFL